MFGNPGLLRCGLRCFSYLQPDVNRASFGEDEPDLIIKLHALAFWKQVRRFTGYALSESLPGRA